jgi:phospholipid/cholesterol/gamma-HCH transport system substrate-binding protein
MVMNERVMQFRIGMFVIVAGLVLTMLIVWFGESPLILHDHVYLTVHYREAPGVAEGTPVRKSGIRIGEVSSITFDERPDQADGVLVMLSLDRKYKLKRGTVPRLSRSLIGDVTIDMLPGVGPALIATGDTPLNAPIVEGAVAADPSKALEAATLAFEKAGGTLTSIDEAATGLAELTKSAAKLDQFLTVWSDTGKNVGGVAQRLDTFISTNEGDFQPTLMNLRDAVTKFNNTLDSKMQDELKTGINRFAMASARLDAGLADAAPLLRDIGLPATAIPRTDFGQTLRRLNKITTDLGLLTQTLNNGRGGLNPEGSLQKILMRAELYDNINKMSTTMTDTFLGFRPVIAAFKVFAEKVSRDPGSISRGAFDR